MSHFQEMSRSERLVYYVQRLEELVERKQAASEALTRGFDDAKIEGFDPQTLRIVLKLRKMTPSQRRERRALESIYLAALGMLDGDPLTDEARRRLDPPPAPPDGETSDDETPGAPAQRSAAPSLPAPPKPEQPPLVLKEPDEARAEGAAAAAAGKRIYDNPYPAGDPCRAAWDEGWCSHGKSHGMEMPEAYKRRSAKPAEPPASEDAATSGAGEGGDAKQGAA
jgi:uncharacterized protein (UPF0335 family)